MNPNFCLQANRTNEYDDLRRRSAPSRLHPLLFPRSLKLLFRSKLAGSLVGAGGRHCIFSSASFDPAVLRCLCTFVFTARRPPLPRPAAVKLKKKKAEKAEAAAAEAKEEAEAVAAAGGDADGGGGAGADGGTAVATKGGGGNKIFGLASKGKKKEKRRTPGEIRIQKDIAELDGGNVATADFPNPNDLTKFTVTVVPAHGLWKKATYVFSFTIPPLYPHEPPKVHCDTQIYHPNIDTQGNVCLNILREDWKPVLDINAVIYGLIYLFYDPNPNDPLNRGKRRPRKPALMALPPMPPPSPPDTHLTTHPPPLLHAQRLPRCTETTSATSTARCSKPSVVDMSTASSTIA